MYNFATFAVPDTAGCESILACLGLFSGSALHGHERCYQRLKWVMGTHGNAVLRPAISAIRRSEVSYSVFPVRMHVPRPER